VGSVGRRVLVILGALLAVLGGVRAADDNTRASTIDSHQRPALLAQGISADAAVLPPRVEIGTKDRPGSVGEPRLGATAGVRPDSGRRLFVARHRGPSADEARELHLGPWAVLRAPPG